ncbi:MAG TPA: hypothetical protein VF571_12385 [Pyrinomonadaceae bacterium]|jgi:small-conductance mechanosensitive channel
MSEETTKYQKEWEEYRRKRNKMLFSFFSIFLFVAFPALILNLFGITAKVGSGFEVLIFVIWATWYLISMKNFHNWKCPRCNDYFFTYSFWITSPILLDKCRNCGLSKYDGSGFRN